MFAVVSSAASRQTSLPQTALHRCVFPAAENRDFHHRAEARVILDELHHASRDVLWPEDPARRAQLFQALLAEANCHRSVDDLRADRVHANVGLLCQVCDREKLTTPALAAA